MAPLPLPISSIVTSVIAGVAGYYLGKSAGLQKVDTVRVLAKKAEATGVSDEDEFEEEEEEESEEEEAPLEQGSEAKDNVMEELKMVFVVRTDLNMTKGKIAAQCGHAALACYKEALKQTPNRVKRWERYGQAKIALKAEGGEEWMAQMQAIAMSLGVVAKCIRDAGRTQIEANSMTVLGIGPAPKSVINEISGSLKLL